jgi:hypothetical protein
MGAAPIVRVEGARQLRATMAKAGVDLQDLVAANAQVSGYVAGRAATLAPHKSGRLAGSVRGNKAKSQAVVRVGGASVPYAGPIHYGWPARNIAAQPFAVNAAHDTEPIWLRMYLDAIQKVIDKVEGVPGG